MAFSHIHREEAPGVGEPDDISYSELIGESPPCDKCGRKHAIEKVGDADLCAPCADEERDDQEASADL